MDPKSDLEGECVLARFRSVLFQLCTPVSEPVTVSGMDVQLRSRPVGGKGESGGEIVIYLISILPGVYWGYK